MNRLLLLPMLFLFCVIPQMAQDAKAACYKWQTQVDPKFERVEIDESKLSDKEIQTGIGCLLKLKGNKRKAGFTGATRSNIYASGRYEYKTATIEIAALYYISYMFHNNWEHAGSISLYDEEAENGNSKKSIKRAYESYRKWYEKLLEIGLQKAREQKLDPLENSGVSWS
ncbi:MAG TPA: hypothetical protein VF604_17210 [Pyrinomonadaceae bacterium]|jgi:hypothetical protein